MSTNIFFKAYVFIRGNPAVEFKNLGNKTGEGSTFLNLEGLPAQNHLKTATDIEAADIKPTDVNTAVTVTPGAVGVPTTGEDGTGVFLGLLHFDHSEDDVADNEQKKEMLQDFDAFFLGLDTRRSTY
jgi:hypothetical protein